MAASERLSVCFGAFELNEENARLSRDGQAVSLPPKAFAVLCELARHPGQLVTKHVLLDAVWGHQHVSDSVLKTVISELRQALDDDARQPRYIETAARRGYRFIAALTTQRVSRIAQRSSSTRTSLTHTRSVTMVGREAALRRLCEAWNDAADGQRRIVWVAGEAGIGKTTLIEKFIAELQPATSAFGQCVDQHGAGEPYLPVLEALADLCRQDATLVPLLRAVAPTWLLQMPWLNTEAERDTLQRELAGTGQERMLREFGELLEHYAAEQPLLLVTEDLHWGDHATVNLINHVARRRAPSRFLWLGTFRLAEVIAQDHPLKELRHELRLHHLCDEIVLDPFSEQEVADYAASRFPDSGIPDTLIRALHARTDGLPLFIVNVIDDLKQQGIQHLDTQQTAAEMAAMQVPENLAGIIERQLLRLTSDRQDLLSAASVCGVEFDSSILAYALARDTSWVNGHCDDLAREQHWIAEAALNRLSDGSLDTRYAFRHALYRQVLYQRLGPAARARLHGRIADTLARSQANGAAVTAAEVALHYELSHDLLSALRYYAEAAQNAIRRFAPQEALILIERALALLEQCPAVAERDALELVLYATRGVSSAQLFGVSSPESKVALEHAQLLLQKSPQHPARGLVLHALGIVLLVRGEYDSARKLGEHLLSLSMADEDPLLVLSACSVVGQVHALQGRNHEARKWLERGIAVCEDVGDAALHTAFVVDPAVTIYAALSIPLLHLGLVERGRLMLATAMTRSERLGEPMGKMVAFWFSALFEVRIGDAPRVAELAQQMSEIVEHAALAQGKAPSQAFLGWARSYLGAPLEGLRSINDAYQRNLAIESRSGNSELLCYAAEALALAGDWAGARAQLEAAMQTAGELGERVYIPQMLLLQGRIALAAGDRDAARSAMLAAAAEARVDDAVWSELLALVAVCELDESDRQHRLALDRVYGRLEQDTNTVLATRARELLNINSAGNV